MSANTHENTISVSMGDTILIFLTYIGIGGAVTILLLNKHCPDIYLIAITNIIWVLIIQVHATQTTWLI